MLCPNCGASVGDSIRLCHSCQEKEDEQRRAQEAEEVKLSGRFSRPSGDGAPSLPAEESASADSEHAPLVEDELEDPSLLDILRQPLPLVLCGIILLMLFSLAAIVISPDGHGLMFVGGALIILGSIISFISAIVVLVYACQESISWGVACFLFPPVSLVFTMLHWDRCRQPFLAGLLGTIFWFAGIGIGTYGAYQAGVREANIEQLILPKKSFQSLGRRVERRSPIPGIPEI